MIRFSFIVFVTSTLLSVGQTKYRFERASRVVEIKHGRIQGTLIELPIVPTSTGPPTGSSDGDISFEDDAHEPQVRNQLLLFILLLLLLLFLLLLFPLMLFLLLFCFLLLNLLLLFLLLFCCCCC